MTYDLSTADAIVVSARDLFAQHGYDGTSVRAVTEAADVNLGAVTYHFGSKAALYAAVVASVAGPLYERVLATAAHPAPPPERLAAIVAAYFEHFADHPDMPKLILQQMFTDHPLPVPLREAMAGILAAIAEVITEGQAAGSFRAGHPVLLALSTLAQPIYFNIIRRPLAMAGLFDLGETADQNQVTDHVARFVLAGLAAGRATDHPPLGVSAR